MAKRRTIAKVVRDSSAAHLNVIGMESDVTMVERLMNLNLSHVSIILYLRCPEENIWSNLNNYFIPPIHIDDGEGIGLKGEIAPEIFFIPNLKDLEIEFFDADEKKRGKLGGTIPATIGNASKLRALDIQKQSLEGTIPEELYDATSLREIDLDSNKLTGTISDSIGKLTNLVFFTAVDNDFDEQEIPSTFSQLTSLKYFGLNNANLVGAVPDGLGNLVQMLFLDLSDNALTGDISFIEDYTNIITIALDNNEFDGDIPEPVWGFQDLEVLNLENNGFTGSIPSSVSGLKKIKSKLFSRRFPQYP